jgi:hypothetical protein
VSAERTVMTPSWKLSSRMRFCALPRLLVFTTRNCAGGAGSGKGLVWQCTRMERRAHHRLRLEAVLGLSGWLGLLGSCVLLHAPSPTSRRQRASGPPSWGPRRAPRAGPAATLAIRDRESLFPSHGTKFVALGVAHSPRLAFHFSLPGFRFPAGEPPSLIPTSLLPKRRQASPAFPTAPARGALCRPPGLRAGSWKLGKSTDRSRSKGQGQAFGIY